ncbi:MAG: hypothetical protein JO128_11530 [Alphaproteobacteria bacterium]|nr:hypothetical protein [Alphaproteobacteria bacterium]
MPKLAAVLTAILCLSSANALAQVYWGQRAQPLPSAAPHIVQGPQPFQPNPSLGTQQQPPPNYFQPQPPPAQGGFNVLNLNNGDMKTCRVYGNQVTCF